MSSQVESPLLPQEVLDRAEAFAVERGFTVASRTNASVVFERIGGPNMGISCALMALFIVPGLIYYTFASGKRFKTTLAAVKDGKGSQVSYSSEDWFARAYMGEFLESIKTKKKPQVGASSDPFNTRTR